MKMKTLTSAILLSTLPVTGTFAAALDRSGQSISAFLQPGNYAEAGLSILDPDVSGKETAKDIGQDRNIDDMAGDYFFPSAAIKIQPTKNFSLGLLYDQPFGADALYQGENIFVSDSSNTVLAPGSLAVIRENTINTQVAANLPNALEQNLQPTISNIVTQQAQAAINNGTAPAGATLAQVEASIRANATQMGAIEAGARAGIENTVRNTVTTQVDAGLANVNGLLGKGATQVEVKTQNLSLIAGFQPNENWNFYAGPVHQTVKGNLALRGQGYSIYNGYDASIPEDSAVGWLAGAAFQIPEIALKASITYRSEIDHDVKVNENIPALPALSLLPNGAAAAANIAASSGETKITTPQSVNVDLQSGIMADTVAFLNLRWVEWSKFSIRPHKFGLLSEAVGGLITPARPNGFNLVEYSDDQISAVAGVGRKFSEQWAGNVAVGWDSGAGNPVSTLGPTEGYWNVGVGLQYSPTPQTFIAGGVKYFWLGDAKAQTGAQAGSDDAYVAEFTDNNAIAYGLKIGYRF